jgi:hypothetical protein
MLYYTYASDISMFIVHDIMIASLAFLFFSILPVMWQLYQRVLLREKKLFLLLGMCLLILLEGLTWLLVPDINYTFGLWLAIDALYFVTFTLLSHYYGKTMQASNPVAEVGPAAAREPLLSTVYGYTVVKTPTPTRDSVLAHPGASEE